MDHGDMPDAGYVKSAVTVTRYPCPSMPAFIFRERVERLHVNILNGDSRVLVTERNE
jgi:hypothetical protein